MVRLVDQLEADGHVTRARGTADRRTVHVTLTESGWALAREIATARLSILRAEVEALDADDRAALDRICATLLARRIDSLRAAERTCRLCEPHACGHPQRCPVTNAANAHRPVSRSRAAVPLALIGLAALAPFAFSAGPACSTTWSWPPPTWSWRSA